MRNKFKISQLADCIAGYTFRESITAIKNGTIYVIQAKNINVSPTVSHTDLTRTAIATSHTKAFTKLGDVVIGSRGVFRAAVIQSNENILASSSLFILRIREKTKILPDYLALFLNSVAGQRTIKQLVSHGTIPNLLKKDLRNITIPTPTIEKQKQMIALSENIREQMELLNRKVKAQENLLNGILNEL